MKTLNEAQSSLAAPDDADLVHDRACRALAPRVRVFRMIFGLIVVAFLLAVGTARAAVPPGAGSLLTITPEGPRQAARVSTDVNMTINGLIARVLVRQAFRNDSDDWVEARYTFPLPDTAAVDRLHIRAGERVIVGEIAPRQRARKTYDEAKRAGRKAAVVEQQRANLFETSVANLGPDETMIVEIEYQQRVDYDQGNFSLRFPMAVTPRFAPAASGAPPDAALPRCVGDGCARARLQVSLTAGFALESVTSRYHPIDVVAAGERHSITLRGDDTLMDRDFELVWRPAHGSEPQVSLFVENVGDDHYGMAMIIPPHVRGGPRRSRELILVIDRSGSMGGASIRQARAALGVALSRLTPADRFNVIAFSDRATPLFDRPLDADRASLDRARRFVDGLDARGGTNMADALAVAFDDRAMARAAADGLLRQIVFVTDGAVGNEASLFALIRRDLGDARLFTVGIGAAPNSYFMRRAASFGRGGFTHIGALDEVQQRMGDLLLKLESPVLTDLSIDWSVPLAEPPRPIGDLYFGEPLLLTVKLSQPPAWLRLDTAANRSQRLRPVSRSASGVATLWARERVAQLMDQRLTANHRDALDAQIVDLALRHHLVTQLTSLVAVERTPSRPIGAPLGSHQVAGVLPAGMATPAVGFPMGATSSRLHILAGLLTLLGALLVTGLRWSA